jgi:hypothetical protein
MAPASPATDLLAPLPPARSLADVAGLRRADLPVALALMVLGLALRLAWFSGVGLGDDPQWVGFLRGVETTGLVPIHDNVSYRFTWWLPTLAAVRLFGFTDGALVGPVLAASTIGIGLVYVLGSVVAGRAAGAIAALLLVFLPIDFAWSTMMANDVLVSVCGAASLLLALLALEDTDEARKGWLWAGSALCVWLALHAKLNGVLMLPVIALAAWHRRRQLDAHALWFVIAAALLVGGSMAVSHGLTGDALGPYHTEMDVQGLSETGPAIEFHRLTAPVFWTWMRALLWPTNLQTLLFSVYPHLVLAWLVLARRTGPPVPWEIAAWLLVLLVGMHLNSLRQVDGVWVSGFRNVRHAHVLAYPVVVLLCVPLAALRARRPRWFAAAMAALVAVSLWQSIATAGKTHVAFADRRAALRFLAGQPLKPVFSDFQLGLSMAMDGLPHAFQRLDLEPEARREELAPITDGYCVTGGGREPVYGCLDCIPRASELPRGRWRLVFERGGPPPSWWRPEPLRVWEAVEPPQM